MAVETNYIFQETQVAIISLTAWVLDALFYVRRQLRPNTPIHQISFVHEKKKMLMIEFGYLEPPDISKFFRSPLDFKIEVFYCSLYRGNRSI